MGCLLWEIWRKLTTLQWHLTVIQISYHGGHLWTVATCICWKLMRCNGANFAITGGTRHCYIAASVQDCSISSELAMEILQSCTTPSIYTKCAVNDDQALWKLLVFIVHITTDQNDKYLIRILQISFWKMKRILQNSIHTIFTTNEEWQFILHFLLIQIDEISILHFLSIQIDEISSIFNFNQSKHNHDNCFMQLFYNPVKTVCTPWRHNH